ncbi:AAA family ATPase [Amorphus coralli]|uniref:AAA family ATPase n=1 Tax=Amorphus coralli TaxID=340680 RepID=UPI001AEC2BBA|nr:AAA family ATPase [Amorphus coralli]
MLPRRRLRSQAATMPIVLDEPFGAYEKHVLRTYALAALTPDAGRAKREILDDLVIWYRDNRELLGYRISPIDALLHKAEAERGLLQGRVLRFASGSVPKLDGKAPARSALQKRLDWIADTLRLDPVNASFLGAVVRLTHLAAFRELYDAVVGDRSVEDEVAATTVAHLAGLSPRQARRATDLRSPLHQLGLLEDRGGGDVAVSATIIDLLSQRTTDADRLRSVLLGRSDPSSLALTDFSYLGDAARTAIALVAGALEREEKGAGFLFYGPPGTGKTEFARLIGEQVGAHVVFVGELNPEEGDRNLRGEPSRADRLSHLAFASALAQRAGRVILVVDEADDVFTGVDDGEFSNRSGSKVFMNRIVEACPVPMIWITNHADRLGEAVLRRMLYAVRFREVDQATRRRIVERHCSARNVELSSDHVDRLARLPATPALLGTGVRAASLVSWGDGSAGEVAIAVTRSLLTAQGHRQVAEPLGATAAFDACLSNADVDLATLEGQVAAAGHGALSFLLSGPPGTGKSAFARHLASRLGLEILERRGSDLLGMFVGETEKRIAEAFAEAAEMKRFLIFDEVDSLLADRGTAHRNWEVGQVNEMLTWMERHPTPFAATTNLADRLDPAVQRRFLFKVTFGPMTPEQIEEAFRRFFAAEAPPSVRRLSQLTPGDIAVVARKAEVLGVSDPLDLARMIEAEVALKPSIARRIGF